MAIGASRQHSPAPVGRFCHRARRRCMRRTWPPGQYRGTIVRQEPEFTVRVTCSVGRGGEPAPMRFSLGAVPIEVVEVVDAWFGADHSYFKVRADDGACYILRHHLASGWWQLTFYDAARVVG